MGIKTIVVLLVGLALTSASLAQAQQQTKLAKIGWLAPGNNQSSNRFEEFLREFRKLGYVDGKNVSFETRYFGNEFDRLPALAEELVGLKVDVIVTRGTPETLALKKATKTIPIVFYSVTDPIGARLVDSLARPGGNITGFTGIEAVLAGKRLELLKETLPKLSRVAVLWNPQDRSSVQQWKESQSPARELGLQLHSMEVSSSDKYESSFKVALNAGSTALAVIAGSLEDANATRIANLATKNRLPAIYPRRSFVNSGGLMAYGSAAGSSISRVAVMVDKILKGTKPADLPVEQPTKFELVINLKTAKALGLTIPPMVMMRADKVIK
jgi:putative ABC transport system substrate-binding protein